MKNTSSKKAQCKSGAHVWFGIFISVAVVGLSVNTYLRATIPEKKPVPAVQFEAQKPFEYGVWTSRGVNYVVDPVTRKIESTLDVTFERSVELASGKVKEVWKSKPEKVAGIGFFSDVKISSIDPKNKDCVYLGSGTLNGELIVEAIPLEGKQGPTGKAKVRVTAATICSRRERLGDE